MTRQQNDRAWLAWHIAALPRMKMFPKLSALQQQPRGKPSQSWHEQLAIAHQWAMRGYGTVGKH